MHNNLDITQFKVQPGTTCNLKDYDTAWMGTPEMEELGADKLKKHAKKYLKARKKELSEAQELLYASNQYSLLLIFQGRDAAGKDGTIKHVMSGVNPQGCQVFSFKAPSKEELDHNYLWRAWKALPERGRIGIFNRSYYEQTLIVRVHPHFLEGQQLPDTHISKNIWNERFEDINAFEKHMVRNGTVILKFYLNLSKEEQKSRFLDRLRMPEKHWKFSDSDLSERRYWDDYTHAFEETLSATSTEYAPWYVIPADRKWVMRVLVGHIITDKLLSLDLKFPQTSSEKKAKIQEALTELENE